MKVLHLIDSSGLYGAEAVVLNLATQQRRKGLDARIGSIGARGEHKAIEDAAAFRSIPVERLEVRSGLNPGALRIVVRHLQASAPGIVHTHGYKANVLTAMALPAGRRVPVVATLHGWTSTGHFDRNAVYEWLDRRLLYRKDALVIVAKAMKSTSAVRRHKAVYVIQNGIGPPGSEDGPVAPDLRSITEFCCRAPTFISIGRLSREKNHADAIRAIARLRQLGETVQLLIVGEGDLRMELASISVAQGVEDLVRMPGYVENPSRLFSYVRGLIVTSLTEGVPLAVLEAMRDHVPIVSTAVGDIADLTSGQAGAWLLDRSSLKEVSGTILTLLRDPAETNKRVNYSRQRWERHFTLERMAIEYSEVYRFACRAGGIASK